MTARINAVVDQGEDADLELAKQLLVEEIRLLPACSRPSPVARHSSRG